jgi:hypothetical protein
MVENQRDEATEHPVVEAYRRELENVQNNLLAVIRQSLPRVGVQLMMHAIIEVAGSVGEDVIVARPTLRATLVSQTEQLTLHLATIGTRPQ